MWQLKGNQIFDSTGAKKTNVTLRQLFSNLQLTAQFYCVLLETKEKDKHKENKRWLTWLTHLSKLVLKKEMMTCAKIKGKSYERKIV